MSKIEFISTVPGLEDIEDCRPKPAKSFLPKWFKDIPSSTPGISTVKVCPSFPDYFSLGYIVPMWADTQLFFNAENGDYTWNTTTPEFKWDIHGRAQFLEYAPASLNGVKANFVFKSICPWRVITPKGWSVLQLPLFYHFNQKWSIMPGVVDTDIHHEINQQVLYHTDSEQVDISRGEPFVLYVPFKRKDKLDLEVKAMTQEYAKIFRRNDLDIGTKFPPNGIYRRWQRERDKK